MSEQKPEFNRLREPEIRHSDFEEGSFTGSAQSIGLQPSEDFIPPSMAMDSFEPESD